jgi:hypothetical protein
MWLVIGKIRPIGPRTEAEDRKGLRPSFFFYFYYAKRFHYADFVKKLVTKPRQGFEDKLVLLFVSNSHPF